jgi:hypothetical protein
LKNYDLISFGCFSRLMSGIAQRGRLVAFATAAEAAAAAVAASAAAVFFRTSFVDVQRSPIQIPAVDFGNGPIPLGVIAHFDESKASGLARIAVRDDADAVDGSVCFKHGSNPVFGSSEAEVAYKNIFHLILLSGICRTVIRGRIEQAVKTGRGKMPKTTNCQTTPISSHVIEEEATHARKAWWASLNDTPAWGGLVARARLEIALLLLRSRGRRVINPPRLAKPPHKTQTDSLPTSGMF